MKVFRNTLIAALIVVSMVACSNKDTEATKSETIQRVTEQTVSAAPSTADAATEAADEDASSVDTASEDAVSDAVETATEAEETAAVDKQESENSIIYVDADATGLNDGSSWADAFNDLQDAIASSTSGDSIWVADGTYYASTDDATESFSLVDGTDLYGGFAGTETSIDERDLSENETILSGDFLNTPDDATDNTNNILLATNGVINGLTITGGYSESFFKMKGPDGSNMKPESDASSVDQELLDQIQGDSSMPEMSTDSGVNVGHSSPTEVLSGDAESTRNGAGIVVWNVSATIENVKITDCYSDKGGGMYINATGSLEQQPILNNVVFENCTAVSRGGALSIDMLSNPILIDCQFFNNTCESKGGALYDDFSCSPRLYNCLFVNNTSEVAGAMGNDGTSNPIIVNTTFTGNSATEEGGSLYQGTGEYNDPVVINSVISGNEGGNGQSSIFNYNECNTAVYSSIIEGGYNGTGSDITDATAEFDDSYNCLTDPGKGYSSENVGTRSSDEIDSIIENLESIENTPLPTSIAHESVSTEVAASTEVYVAVDGDGDGSSADQAMSDVQTAIDMAHNYYVANGDVVNVYLADGTYYPGTERSDSFTLLEGVNLIGESEAGTILSGEIGGPDKSDNSYHVVIGSNNASLTDLTITGGNADGLGGQVYDRLGGGLLNYLAGNRVSPTYEPLLGFDTQLTNVYFYNNSAIAGGATYTYFGGNPVFTGCTFDSNSAVLGGATYEVGSTDATYNECIFIDNSAENQGGSSYVDYGAMTEFYSCDFISNTAVAGGALYAIDRASQDINNDTNFSELVDSTWTTDTDIYSTAYFDTCTFDSNTASNEGNALYAIEGSYIKLVNTDVADADCYITENSHLIR